MIKNKKVSKTEMRLRALQQYALTKARSWKDPVLIKRFLIEAYAIKPLTDMQWWRLDVHHGAVIIEPIKQFVLKKFSGAGAAERVVPSNASRLSETRLGVSGPGSFKVTR